MGSPYYSDFAVYLSSFSPFAWSVSFPMDKTDKAGVFLMARLDFDRTGRANDFRFNRTATPAHKVDDQQNHQNDE